jgi:hypothetical protein
VERRAEELRQAGAGEARQLGHPRGGDRPGLRAQQLAGPGVGHPLEVRPIRVAVQLPGDVLPVLVVEGVAEGGGAQREVRRQDEQRHPGEAGEVGEPAGAPRGQQPGERQAGRQEQRVAADEGGEAERGAGGERRPPAGRLQVGQAGEERRRPERRERRVGRGVLAEDPRVGVDGDEGEGPPAGRPGGAAGALAGAGAGGQAPREGEGEERQRRRRGVRQQARGGERFDAERAEAGDGERVERRPERVARQLAGEDRLRLRHVGVALGAARLLDPVPLGAEEGEEQEEPDGGEERCGEQRCGEEARDEGPSGGPAGGPAGRPLGGRAPFRSRLYSPHRPPRAPAPTAGAGGTIPRPRRGGARRAGPRPRSRNPAFPHRSRRRRHPMRRSILGLALLFAVVLLHPGLAGSVEVAEPPAGGDAAVEANLVPPAEEPHEDGHDEGHGGPVVPVLLGLVVILVAAKAGGELFERLGQPAVLGELMLGVILGNLTLVGFTGFEFLTTNEGLEILAQIGVILLLFEVGLESNVAEMLSVGASSLVVALLGIVAPFLLGWGVSAWLLPDEERCWCTSSSAPRCAPPASASPPGCSPTSARSAPASRRSSSARR